MSKSEDIIRELEICRCNVIKAIPLAFDESYSYMDMLAGILAKLNETIEQVNSNTKFIDEYQETYDELQRQIDVINTTIVSIQNVLSRKADKSYVDTQDQKIIADMTLKLEQEYLVLKQYVDGQVQNLQYQIDHFNVENIFVYDPTTGYTSPLGTVLDNIYNATRNEAITASEFDELELTAGVYDDKDIEAGQFDRYGKTILIPTV